MRGGIKDEGVLETLCLPVCSHGGSGDLPHDVIQAAAMLLVVISNVLNSTLPSTVEDGHKELLTNWLSHSDLKPFSKLALCYAFLAKIPASVLVGVVLRGEPLLLVLFPVICDLFDG